VRGVWLLLGAACLLLNACARRSGAEQVPSQSQSTKAAPTPAIDPQKARAEALVSEGAALHAKYCKLCHGADGQGYAADNAPSLVSDTFLASASDEFIASGIRLGRSNTAMAAYGQSRGGPLDDAQINAIVAFLRSKGPPRTVIAEAPLSGDAARGAASFEKNCQSCHGTPAARGTAPQLQNPEFLNASTPGFWRYAIEKGRPPTPMPAFAGKLPASEIEDIVSWLGKLAGRGQSPRPTSALVPDNLPLVINPGGRAPKFQLRDGRFVSSEQVKRALEEKRRLVIIDARTPSDWIQFHIPGSVPIPYYDVEKLARIPNDGTWVIAYCACPHHASGEVVDALKRKNYAHAAVLDEGILFWKDRGYPLAGEAVAKKP
jgi:cytochrome c oxidase cbb3-type subunit 3